MVYYQRNLPHFQPEGYAYFITTRLAGTIPADVYKSIQDEYEKELDRISGSKNKLSRKESYEELKTQQLERYEKILDSCKYGYRWLEKSEISNIISEALHHRDGSELSLIAYTIMPNHIHIVFYPIVERFAESLKKQIKNTRSETAFRSTKETILLRSESPTQDQSGQAGDSLYIVTKIMQDFKKYTAREANKILNRSGKFWQHESYDHVIRDSDELKRIVEYVLNNPVKAGLCNDPEEWKYSYYNPKYLA